MLTVKAHANGRNKCQRLPILLGFVGQQCCVRLHWLKSRLRVVSSFPLVDRRESNLERREKFISLLLPSSPLSLFCPRPTFRALSHFSRFDSRRSTRGNEEITRSLLESLTGFKLYATSANIVVVPCKRTQQVTALLGLTMLDVVGQQCWVRLHGP